MPITKGATGWDGNRGISDIDRRRGDGWQRILPILIIAAVGVESGGDVVNGRVHRHRANGGYIKGGVPAARIVQGNDVRRERTAAIGGQIDILTIRGAIVV